MRGKSFAALAAVVCCASADAEVVISEVLACTFGVDVEFIEIANLGDEPVDISGWRIELWDSDIGTPGYGGADAISPYHVEGSVVLAPGAVYAWGNPNAVAAYGQHVFAGPGLPFNAIENESFTIVLANARGRAVDSGLILDGDAADQHGANRAGSAITPRFLSGPEGLFLPAGIFRRGDEYHLLDFYSLGDGTFEGGTPGLNQIAFCAGDVSGDGTLGPEDLIGFLDMFRTGSGDLNGDGRCDAGDLVAFLASFRTGC